MCPLFVLFLRRFFSFPERDGDCREDGNDCVGQEDTCKNGGACVDLRFDFECLCPIHGGFGGPTYVYVP